MAQGREIISQISLLSSGAEPGSRAEQQGGSCGDAPISTPELGDGARENQPAAGSWLGNLRLLAEGALRSQHICSQGATSARGLLPCHSNYFKIKLSSEKA